jgi:hypothetical protein
MKTNSEIVELMLEAGAVSALSLFADIPLHDAKAKHAEFAELREQFRGLLELNFFSAKTLCRDYEIKRGELIDSILVPSDENTRFLPGVAINP